MATSCCLQPRLPSSIRNPNPDNSERSSGNHQEQALKALQLHHQDRDHQE
jgi:hypothetical protein